MGAPAKLLAPSNIDYSRLLEYVTDVVKYATQGTLRNLELKIVGNNQPDIAAFDFTSIKKAEHAARIIERKGSKLLIGLVGDSLLEVSIETLPRQVCHIFCLLLPSSSSSKNLLLSEMITCTFTCMKF